jgi:hypothetical protein
MVERDARKEIKASSPLSDHHAVLALMRERSIPENTPIELVVAKLSVAGGGGAFNDAADKLRRDWNDYLGHLRRIRAQIFAASTGIDPTGFGNFTRRITFANCFEMPFWDEENPTAPPRHSFPALWTHIASDVAEIQSRIRSKSDARAVQRKLKEVVSFEALTDAVEMERVHLIKLGHYRAAQSISSGAFRDASRAARLCLDEASHMDTAAPPSATDLRESVAGRLFVDRVQTTYHQLKAALSTAFNSSSTVSKEDTLKTVDKFLAVAAELNRISEAKFHATDTKTLMRDVDLKKRILDFDKAFLVKMKVCVSALDKKQVIEAECAYSSVCPWYITNIHDGIVVHIKSVISSLETDIHKLEVNEQKSIEAASAKLMEYRTHVACMDWFAHVRETLDSIRKMLTASSSASKDYQALVLKTLSEPVTVEHSLHSQCDTLASKEHTTAHGCMEICRTGVIARARLWAAQLTDVLDSHFGKQQIDLDAHALPTRRAVIGVWEQCSEYELPYNVTELERHCDASRSERRTLGEYHHAWSTVILSDIERSAGGFNGPLKRKAHDDEEVCSDDDGGAADGRRTRHKVEPSMSAAAPAGIIFG